MPHALAPAATYRSFCRWTRASFQEGSPTPMRFRLFTTISIGLLSAACQSPYQQTAWHPAPVTPPISTAGYSTSEQACNDYGFNPGTGAFDRCVQRERYARAAGRVHQNYAEA